MEGGHPTATLILALAAGVAAQSVSRHLRIPGIVLLLIVGASMGPDGLAWIDPNALGKGLLAVVDIAVAVILFEGGLNLQIRRLRREQLAIRRLVTIGALITMLGGALAVRVLLDWGWIQCFLFGSLVVVTGPTVVGPLISEVRLKPKVSTVLQAEGVLIDPVGAILAVLVLELVASPDVGSLREGALDFLFRVGFGAAAGALGGLLLAMMLRPRRLIPEGHENILTLALVLLLFQACDAVVSESGILAVTLAGVVVGNVETRVESSLREFKDQLSVMLIGLLFVLLAADVRVEQVRALGAAGLAVVALLVLVVRPLNVLASTLQSELSWREKVLVAWIAPRGIVAAAIASVVAVALDSRGLAGGAELRALVFLVITCTVLLAGLTALPMASLLGLRLPSRDTLAILGVGGLGLALAEYLKAAGTPVVFLDSNASSCRQAEEAGYPVVFGNALQERTLQRARFDRVNATVALTSNQTLNSLFVTRARELFRVPDAYVAVVKVESAYGPELARREWAHLLFESPHDVERWDVRSHHGELAVEHRVFEEPTDPEAAAAASPGERFVILAVQRGKKIVPMSPAWKAQPGDRALVAMHVPEREEASRILTSMGWSEEIPGEAEAEDS